MPKRQKTFIGVAIFALLLAPFSFDTLTTVVPGWHTTIINYDTPGFYKILLPIYFFGISTIYRRLFKKDIKINKLFFRVHVLLSVLFIAYINHPFLEYIINPVNFNPQQLILEFKVYQSVAYLLLAGQLFF